MSPRERSAGTVFCIVLAALSTLTAVILSVVALNATSQLSKEPLDEYGSRLDLFDDADCTIKSDAPPTQENMKCFAEYQAATQRDAANWEREVTARQADVQAKGDLAIVFGLLGATFAFGAVVAGRGGRTTPHTTGTPAAPATPDETPTPPSPSPQP